MCWCTTRASLFGDHEFAYRLPAFAGYWVGLLSLFVYLCRRVPASWALAGTVLSMTMAAFDYSYESRSYPIFYGLAMLAMLCWTRAVDPARTPGSRRLAIAGMMFALAAGISTNYFAVLAFLLVAAGEAARTLGLLFRPASAPAFSSRARYDAASEPRYDKVTRAALLKAIDFPIWIALALSGSVLLAYRSMIAHSIAQFAPYAWNKVSLDQVFDSYTEMVEVVLYPILALLVLAILVFLLSRLLAPVCQSCRGALSRRWFGPMIFPAESRLSVPLHEIVAILAFMTYPILGYILASIRGGMLSPRFVIPVCFGFAIAATFVAFRLFGALPHAATAMLCFCLAWFIARESVVAYWYEEQKQCFYKVLASLPQAEAQVPSAAPLVIPDPLLALTFQHYAPPALAARVVFPVDFPAIRFYRHDDSPEENLWAGRNFLYTLPIVPLAAFQHDAGRYLVIAADGNWLIQDMAAHHYGVRRLPINTRADAIGGFTPLARGTPAFFVAGGDQAPIREPVHVTTRQPFRASDNLPNATFKPPDDTAQE